MSTREAFAWASEEQKATWAAREAEHKAARARQAARIQRLCQALTECLGGELEIVAKLERKAKREFINYQTYVTVTELEQLAARVQRLAARRRRDG